MRYIKESPRISVKIYNSETEELLIAITDRSWMNIGEIFPQANINALLEQEFKNKKHLMPKKVLVMVAEEYVLE